MIHAKSKANALRGLWCNIIRCPDFEIQYKQTMNIYVCVCVYLHTYICVQTQKIPYFFTAALYNALPSQRDLPLCD